MSHMSFIANRYSKYAKVSMIAHSDYNSLAIILNDSTLAFSNLIHKCKSFHQKQNDNGILS